MALPGARRCHRPPWLTQKAQVFLFHTLDLLGTLFLTDANESAQKRRQALEIDAKFSEPSNAKNRRPEQKTHKKRRGEAQKSPEILGRKRTRKKG